ncbi:MAG: hypothetical protein ACHQZR_09720 [Candidatus Limnocylindrales bacterium]
MDDDDVEGHIGATKGRESLGGTKGREGIGGTKGRVDDEDDVEGHRRGGE